MASSPTFGLTTVTDPKLISKIILVFEPSTKFPQLAPVLSENYVLTITGSDLVECRYASLEDKAQCFIQHANGINKYFVDHPDTVKIKILNFIIENTPNTIYLDSSKPPVQLTGKALKTMKSDLLTSIFDDNMNIQLTKANQRLSLSSVEEILFLVDYAIKIPSNMIVLFLLFPCLYSQVPEMKFNPVNLRHLTKNFDERYQKEDDDTVASVSPTMPTSFDFSEIVTSIKRDC